MLPPSLSSYVRGQLRELALGGLFLLATNALGLAIPWLIKQAVDRMASGAGSATVGEIVLLIVGVAVLQTAIRIGSRISIFFAARQIEFRLRNDFYAQLCRLPASYYRGQRTGDLVSRATNDLTNVRALLGPGILNVINSGAVYLAAPVLLVLLSPQLTLLALLPYPVMLLVARHHMRGIYQKSRESQEELSRLSSRVQENLTGIAVVKAYAREDGEVAEFAALSRAYQDQSLALARYRSRMMPLLGAMAGLATVIVLVAGGELVRSGEITLGEFVAFTGYLGYLVWPTLALGWILSLWQRGMASWDRLRAVLAEAPALRDPPDPLPLPAWREGIEIRGLRIAHGAEVVLDLPALRLAAGSTVAVVGPTGSGKTTLAEVLARVTEIPAGTVFVDGVDLTRVSLGDYRRQVGYVPQETFLFSASVAQNIAIGRPGSSAEEIRRVAEVARLDGDVGSFPKGYDTLVGERGIAVSGGQRQRVAIARALLVDPRLLVLDDCLSAVDLKTEREILAGLRRELAGRTALVISHRLAAARLASEILVLDRGRLVERGSHEALLSRQGLYASLWKRQMMLEELETLTEAAS
jgi:ATP-binding cassette subfamily B protein